MYFCILKIELKITEILNFTFRLTSRIILSLHEILTCHADAKTWLVTYIITPSLSLIMILLCDMI